MFPLLNVGASGVVKANAGLREVTGSFVKDIVVNGFPAGGCVAAAIEDLQGRLIWVADACSAPHLTIGAPRSNIDKSLGINDDKS